MERALPLTRLELKRQRDALSRFERFLPALKRKQQQLQLALLQLNAERGVLLDRLAGAESVVVHFEPVLHDLAGVDVRALARPVEVAMGSDNVAGVSLPRFEGARFPELRYSLFATPPWVDRAVLALREVARVRAELDVLERRRSRLARELSRVLQRVNLFEKVKIPRAAEAIRRIRIHLGDEMSAAVGRAKLAKAKLTGGA
jgi:V/A-type H+/Na+-transporting ATPase subunit D